MKQFYRQLLKKSYLIAKRYKFLWFFGVFAALFGNGGEVQMLFRASEIVPKLPTNLNAWSEFISLYTPAEFLANAWYLIQVQPAVAIPLFIILLLIFVFIVWMVMIGQAGLVYGAARINSSKAVDFRSVFAASYPFAPKAFVLNFLTRFILYGGLVILLIPFAFLVMINNENPIGMYGIILLSFIVLVPLAMIMNFILKYAMVYLVVEGESVGQSFLKAFSLFWKNWFVSIEMAVLMFLINLAVGISVFILLFFVGVPFLALAVLFSALGYVVMANLAFVVALLLFIVLIVMAGAWLATFQYSAWTMLFFEIKKGRAYPKLMRMVAKS